MPLVEQSATSQEGWMQLLIVRGSGIPGFAFTSGDFFNPWAVVVVVVVAFVVVILVFPTLAGKSFTVVFAMFFAS